MITEDLRVDSDTPGIRLFVRNKRRKDVTAFAPERTLLFVHGSTYPAECAFDLALDGLSWMDYVAGRGFDVYLMDVRGYGASDRPTEMNRPPAESPPLVRTAMAVRDVASVVEFIVARRGIGALNLCGWSWGTTLMGAYTASHNHRVCKLVLLAPQWVRSGPSQSDPGGAIGAYRAVSLPDARVRWMRGVPEDKQAGLLPRDWFDRWAQAAFATDPWGAAQSPPVIRAPNGTVQDSREFWAAGKPFYDPGKIGVPVLQVHADWDQDLPLDMARAYFAQLTGAPYRRWVEIGEGTHSVLLEKNRMQVFEAVQAFLQENFAPAT